MPKHPKHLKQQPFSLKHVLWTCYWGLSLVGVGWEEGKFLVGVRRVSVKLAGIDKTWNSLQRGASGIVLHAPLWRGRGSESCTIHFISTNEKMTLETEPRASLEGHSRRCGNELDQSRV